MPQLVLALMGFAPTQAQANAPTFSTSTIIINSSGSCVDVSAGSTVVGLGIDQWACSGNSYQNFRFTSTSDGYYTIQPQNDNLCLDAGPGSLTTGVQVTQNACTGTISQKWKVNPNTDGSFAIATPDGSGCLDVFAGRIADGTTVTTWACHGSNNESFIMSGFQASPPSSPAPTASSIPPLSSNAAAPRIFNVSSQEQPGNVVSIQGINFDTTSQVWLDGIDGALPVQLTLLNRIGASWMAVQLPPTSAAAMILWISNSSGVSNSVKLNGAVPLNLDTIQLVPGGLFRVVGQNLLLPGYSPSVTVDGIPAPINVGASSQNVLIVAAPASLGATAASTIMVDNGNGSGPAQLDRHIGVVPGSGDPFGLGVGWAAGFTFAGQLKTVATPCDGSHDDSSAIQTAINSVANAGGIVQLPAGNCVLANSLNMKSNVVLQGAGKDVTFLTYQVNYPIYALGLDLIGLRNFTLVNAGSAVEGMLWQQNTRSFFQNIKIRMGITRQLFLDSNQNYTVTQTDFVQAGSLGSQNPYLFSGCFGFVFSGNTSTTIDGSPTFESVHDALIVGNHFTRDAANQNEPVVIFTHQFVMDFAYRIAIIGNTFDVINGPVTNLTRNDGETLLTEGGGGRRTENIGTVASATMDTLTDPNTTLNVNPFGTGLPENYGIAIVNGTGTGQTREVVAYSSNTVRVDHAWDVIPDATSRYATFVWGLEKALIEGNTMIDNPRGIWLYQTAVRQVDISGNTITNGGGIYARTFESSAATQFDAMFNVNIADNKITNSTGLWLSYINAVFVNQNQTNFGMADTGIEIRNNQLTANSPNVNATTEDYANREGFMNLMRSETSGRQLTTTPEVLGTIFQSNQCANCSTAFVIGTGAFGTVFVDNQPVYSSPNFLADWQTLGSSIGASIGTFIQGIAGAQTITVTQPAPAIAIKGSSFQVAATATSGLPVSVTVAGSCSGSGSGSVAISMTAGTGICTISFGQAGDGVNFQAAQGVMQVTTAQLTAASVTFTGAPSNAAYQSTFPVSATTNAGSVPTITATGACSAGTVTGTAASAASIITMTSGTGSCVLSASWAADTTYGSASSGPISVLATKIPPQVLFTGAPASAAGGAAFQVTAITNASVIPNISASGACSAGVVTGTPTTATSLLTMSALPGTCAMTAAWAADANYGATIATLTTTNNGISLPVPTITWNTPAPIAYGAVLGSAQLNATAFFNGTPVAGRFVYSPARQMVVSAGSQLLSVVFTPYNHERFTTASGSVTLQVNQATSKINWRTPAAINYGVAIDSTQLKASASFQGKPIAGTFSYTPTMGTLLGSGSHMLSVLFTPVDATDFTTATYTVTILVRSDKPLINWPTPAGIAFGTPLSATQLDATASYGGTSIAGTFVYSPAAGIGERVGSHRLSVTFTPMDTVDFTTATARATLIVH